MKTHRPSFRRRSGFTLIELLVVVTIIVILAALSLVMTNVIRDRAREANAVNSLRQIGIGQVSYAADHHQAIVTTGASDEDGGSVFEESFWGRIHPYIFSGIKVGDGGEDLQPLELAINSLFQTTDARTMVGTPFVNAPVIIDAGLPVPLGFNEMLEPEDGQPVRTTIFKNPSRIIYATYGRGFFNSSDGAAYTPMPQGSSAGSGIHFLDNKNALIGFLDGRVEVLVAPIPRQFFGEQELEPES